MSLKNKKNIIPIIVVLLFLASVGGLVYMQMTLTQQATVVNDQRDATALREIEELNQIQLRRFLSETERERDHIASMFISSESDSIDFLNFIEQLATEKNVLLETNRVAKVLATTPNVIIAPMSDEVLGGDQAALLAATQPFDSIVVHYDLSGTLNNIQQFVTLIEVVPFVSQVTGVALQRSTGDDDWNATMTIELIVLSHE